MAHLSGSTISGGEPLMAMWAKGKQRLLPAGGGFVDVSDPKNPVVLNKGVVRGNGPVVYNTQLKKWIMMTHCGRAPHLGHSAISARPVRQGAARQSPSTTKDCAASGTTTLPIPPSRICFEEFSTGEKGNGTHHNFYDGGKYAYLDCGWDDQLRHGESPAAV